MDKHWQERAKHIAQADAYATHLGTQFEGAEQDQVQVRLPYGPHLGEGRVHGGAISALVDIAATAAFWCHPDVGPTARGATVGFTINFLSLVVAEDLTAYASVRRRGGTLCTGDVSVRNPEGSEIATAIVTYKLSR